MRSFFVYQDIANFGKYDILYLGKKLEKGRKKWHSDVATAA